MCDSSNTYLTHAISDYIMQESLLKQQTIEKSVSKKLIGKNSFEKKVAQLILKYVTTCKFFVQKKCRLLIQIFDMISFDR